MTQLLMLQYNNIYREEAYCDRIGIQLKTKCKAFYVHMAHDSHHLSIFTEDSKINKVQAPP